MLPDYVDVYFKHRLEQSNAPLEKNKAVVCIQLKDFLSYVFYEKKNSDSVVNVACTNQITAFGHESCTNQITALKYVGTIRASKYCLSCQSYHEVSVLRYVLMEST